MGRAGKWFAGGLSISTPSAKRPCGGPTSGRFVLVFASHPSEPEPVRATEPEPAPPPAPAPTRIVPEKRPEPQRLRIVEAAGACSDAIEIRLARSNRNREWDAIGTGRFPRIGAPTTIDFTYMGKDKYTVRHLEGNALRVERTHQDLGIQRWCYSCPVDVSTSSTILNFYSPSGMAAGDKLLEPGPCQRHSGVECPCHSPCPPGHVERAGGGGSKGFLLPQPYGTKSKASCLVSTMLSNVSQQVKQNQ